MKLEDSMSTKTRRQYTDECKAEAVRLIRARHDRSHTWLEIWAWRIICSLAGGPSINRRRVTATRANRCVRNRRS